MTLFTAKPLPLAWLLAGTAFLPGFALAQADRPDEVDLGGYEITIRDSGNFERELVANGEPLLTDGLIFLDGLTEVAGQQVLTGVSGPGGNACDGTPFVVSLKDGKPALDGPVDSCRWFEMTVGPDRLTFATEPFPGTPAEIWVWTPATGLTEAAPEAFTPKAGQGWDEFSSLATAHPVDALGFAPVYTALRAGMSDADWAQYTDILGQLGSGDLVEGGYRGETCNKIACLSEWAVLWIDQDSERAFAMWKGSEDPAPHYWPEDQTSWPAWIAADATTTLNREN